MTTISSVSHIDWYRSVAPLIALHFGGTPLVTSRYFDGKTPVYSAGLHGPAPGHEPTVDVQTTGGRYAYLAVNETSILYQAHRNAVEVLSWAPRSDDASRAAFARIVISPAKMRPAGWGTRIALAIRSTLATKNCDGILLREGPNGGAVWVPFSDGPTYDVVRAWLHALVTDIVRADPEIDAKELHVSSNAVGRWSCVPYSLIGPEATTGVTPIRWDEIADIPGGLSCDALAARLADDVFGAEVRRIGAQHFGGGPMLMVSGDGHGQILAAVRAILADGNSHSAADICSEGIARGILAPTTIPAYVQHGITTLLDRERDRGEKPEIIVMPNGNYRLNIPIDPYAGFAVGARDRSIIDPLIATLRAAVVRETPASPDDGPNIGAPFERAVAQAFAFLGLDAERFGGQGEPDVVVTAQLGSGTYRVVVECKTIATVKLHGSAAFVVETKRLRDGIGAHYGILLGLDFPDERGIAEELAAHNVALWTLDDLIVLLECQLHHAIKWSAFPPLFAAGRAADAVSGFRAEHVHGAYTRERLVLQYLVQEGLAYQESLVTEGGVPEDAYLTVEALTLLINQRMAREHMLGRCTNADVRAAVVLAQSETFAYVQLLPHDGIVIVRRYEGAD